MELKDYLRFLRKSWIILVVSTLLGGACGYAISLLLPKEYLSATQLFVSVQSAESNSTVDAIQGSNAAQQKVKSYLDVATSAKVLQPVIDQLRLPYTTVELGKAISASSPTNSVLIDLQVRNTSPERAALIANAVAQSLSEVVTGQLEQPLSGGPALVRMAVIEPAKPAGSPASPRVPLNVAIGALAGLLLGLGLGALRTALDTRVHSAADLEALSDRPLLGGIGFDPDAQDTPLVVKNAPASLRAEAFRALRTNLKFIGLDSKSKIFMTTSAMPSEGKTTATANLAVALAESGVRVVLVDADLRRPRVANLMNLDGAVGLTDVLIGGIALDQVLRPWGDGLLTVLPSGSIPPNPSELLGSSGMRAVLERLSSVFDIVLVDAPPVLPVTDAVVLSGVVDGVIVVARSGKTTRSQVRSAIAQLEQVNARIFGTVLTMLPAKNIGSHGYGYGYVQYYSTEDNTVGPDSGDAPRGRRPRGKDLQPGPRRAPQPPTVPRERPVPERPEPLTGDVTQRRGRRQHTGPGPSAGTY